MPTVASRERQMRRIYAATRGSHIWKKMEPMTAGERRKMYRLAAKTSIQLEEGLWGMAKAGKLDWLFPARRDWAYRRNREKTLQQVIAATGIASTVFTAALRMSIIPALAPISGPLMLVSGVLMGGLGFEAAMQKLELEVLAARSGQPREPRPSILPTLDVLDLFTPGELEAIGR